ncbi:MAG: T9SS type A sorting domain-containing protein [Bacteroidetes bacterium]|nr:MAG: T9SS type A sorting domain-containing protein [Bacteroidota bacterium]
MRRIFIFLLFLSTLCATDISAQVSCADLPPGAPPGATHCASACISCDLDGVEDENSGPLFGPQILSNCAAGGTFTLDNPRWYSFIAGSVDLILEIRQTFCADNEGLEVALVENCEGGGDGNPGEFDAIACASGGNPVSLFATNLVPGKQYYLLIDGINGDICKYTIQVAFGSAAAPELGQMGTIQGPQAVCPGAVVNYSLPLVDNALFYTWVSPPGSSINGGDNVFVSSGNDLANTIEVEYGPVGGAVCVTAANVCDTPMTTCIQVTNQAIPITNLPDLEICFEELPFFWPEEPFTIIAAPGTYTLTSTPYQSYLGCDSTVRQKIIARPRKFKILPPVWLCKDDCFTIGGFEFCDGGTYTENIPSVDGCDSLVTFTIVKIPAHAAVLPPDTLTCRDPETVLMADSTITTGNTVTYTWLNAEGDTISTTTSATVDDAGPYYFVVSNYGGGVFCADTAVVTVPVDQDPPVADAGPNRVLNCSQPLTQLQGSGSMGPDFTYLWLAFNGGNIVSGATTLTPTVNAPGTYRLRVTNQHNGCTKTDNMLVTSDTLPPTITATGGTFSCVEPLVGLQAVSNAAGPTYSWTGPNNFTSNQQNPVVGVAGEYVVMVTDSVTGCSNSAIATVVADTDPPGAMATGGVLTCVENTVTLSGSSQTSNPAFSWTGPNGFSSADPNPTVDLEGDYVLTVTGQNGCTSTATAVVVLDNTPPGASISASGNLNCNNATVNLTAGSNAPGNFLEHEWTLPDGSTVSTGNNPILSAAEPGTYSVEITNTENGCTSTADIVVVETPAVTAAISSSVNVSCFGQQNGSATAIGGGGNGTYLYLWNTGDETATAIDLGPGTYTVTVTDGEFCTATSTVTITQPPVLAANVSATPQMANGAADGTAMANPSGGTPTYSYAWSNGESTMSITGLLPGSYTVTITDANGCTAVSIATVNAYNCTIDADVEITDVTCFDQNDGTATAVTISGEAPFTYAWSTGESTMSVGNLAPGIYTVVVTDAANCPEAVAFTISEPNLLKANATAMAMSGPGTNDGSASASPTGGVAPYTYEWSTGDTTATIENLTAGLYTVTVTDSNGCTVVRTVEVLPGNCGITVNFIASPATCNGLATGSATAVLNGGMGPFMYAWSSGGNAATEQDLAAGTYTVTVVDGNGCDLTAEVTITEPPLLTLELDTVINTACPNLPEGSATVIAGGGTSPLVISWSNNQLGATAVNLVAGTYTVSVTDSNECEEELQVTIQAIDNEPPVIAGDSLIAALGTAGSVTMSVQSLGLDVSDNCAIAEVLFSPVSFDCSKLGPHNVVVTAEDEAGNVTVDTIVVTVVDNLPPTLTCPPSVVRCFGFNVVQYPAPVATDNCLGNGGMFDLVSGLPSGAAFPVGTTTNTYTYTDADGNVGSCTFEVTILTQLMLELDTILPDKGGLEIGGVYITVSGSLSPYTYEWFDADGNLVATTADLDSVGSGAYNVLITDEVGCTIEGGPYVIDSLVSAKTPAWAVDLQIFPNPTTGQLSVVFPDQLQDDVQLMVFDMTGRLVVQQNAQAPQRVDFDLSEVPQGLYTILVRVNQQVLARKIVVSR